MNEHDTFESRLATAFAAYADRAPVAVDAVAMTSAASTWTAGSGGRSLFRGGLRLAFVAIAVLLIVAAAAALAGAARLLESPRTPLFGAFATTGTLPSTTQGNRYINAAASLADGRVLAVGMYDSSDPGDTWAYLYDPRAGTWAPTGSEPTYRRLASATTLQDGRVLIVGGWRVDTAGTPVLPAEGELFDPKTGTFTATRGALANPRYSHTATLLKDGRVLITGGAGPDFNAPQVEMASAEIFDPATGLFHTVGSMIEPRQLHAAARLADGRVLITGGMSSRGSVATATTEIFDPATGTFAPAGSMAVARSSHSAVTLNDGRVLIVGGSTVGAAPEDWDPVASAELFDPGTGRFTLTASLATERSDPATTLLPDGRVLVAGGSNDFGAPRTAELFDPATGHFEPAGASAGPHGDAWTGILQDGRVLLLGLVDDPASNGAPELWTGFDRATALPTMTATPGPGLRTIGDSTAVLRSGHTATRLADGRVLLAGGTNAAKPGAKALSSAEIFDPKSGRSTPVGDMSGPRAGHVAVLLPDGRVLVAGGEQMQCPPPSGECTWPSPTAEIFDPGTARFTKIAADLGPAQINSRVGAPVAVLLADGRVLYVGTAFGASTGSDWTGRYVALIDPGTGGAEPAPTIPCTALVSLARLSDGRIFVQCGGRTPGSYEFDATGRTITAISSTERWDVAVTLADGRVLVVRQAGDAAIFDPTSATYTSTGAMLRQDDPDPENRYADPYGRRLTLLSDGRVLASGGRSTTALVPALATAELFDPRNGTFRSIGPLEAARYEHSATLLDDGRVLLFGGVSRSPDRTDPEPAPAEIFDPRAIPPAP